MAITLLLLLLPMCRLFKWPPQAQLYAMQPGAQMQSVPVVYGTVPGSHAAVPAVYGITPTEEKAMLGVVPENQI